MKNQILFFGLALLSFISYAQPAKCDSTAVMLMDRMSDFVGELQSCRFKLNVSEDYFSDDELMLKKFSNDEVHMVGPDKKLVNINGNKGHQTYLYNGSQLAYYSNDENNYALIDAPDNIIETIHKINAEYDLEFPAADFFSPSFTDDLIAASQHIKYVGKSKINGKECFQLLVVAPEFDFQFWICNDAYNLPMKFVYVYKTKKGSPQYEGTFSDWKINSVVPETMYNFVPPPGAKQIQMISKSQNQN